MKPTIYFKWKAASFLKGSEGGGCPRRGANLGTLTISKEDRGTLGNIREITTHP